MNYEILSNAHTRGLPIGSVVIASDIQRFGCAAQDWVTVGSAKPTDKPRSTNLVCLASVPGTPEHIFALDVKAAKEREAAEQKAAEGLAAMQRAHDKKLGVDQSAVKQ